MQSFANVYLILIFIVFFFFGILLMFLSFFFAWFCFLSFIGTVLTFLLSACLHTSLLDGWFLLSFSFLLTLR